MISVVIPVFGVEKLLERCVGSLLAQTYSDFELILVDDGSKDRSGEICDNLVKRDARIRVVHKKNEGVSVARNIGISLANGDWITFVDSDDWVEPNYLASLISPVECDPSIELVVSGIRYFFVHRSRYQTMFAYPNRTIDVLRMPEEISTLGLLKNGCPVGKLYKRSVIVDCALMFNSELSINEDHLFVLQYYNIVQKMATVDGLTYNYYYDYQLPSLTKIRHSSDEYLTIAHCMSREFRKFIGRFDGFPEENWASVSEIFGPQQIMKALESSIQESCPLEKIRKIRQFVLMHPDFMQGRNNRIFILLKNNDMSCLYMRLRLSVIKKSIIEYLKFYYKNIHSFNKKE